jgi:hypothetical protein
LKAFIGKLRIFIKNLFAFFVSPMPEKTFTFEIQNSRWWQKFKISRPITRKNFLVENNIALT